MSEQSQTSNMDVIAVLNKMQLQLEYLEKKIDALVNQSVERSASSFKDRPYRDKPSYGKSYGSKPYSKPYKSYDRDEARPYQKREESGSDRPYKRREESDQDRPYKKSVRPEYSTSKKPYDKDRPYVKREGGPSESTGPKKPFGSTYNKFGKKRERD